MSFYISSDHFGLLRLNKKRAVITLTDLSGLMLDEQSELLGPSIVINEDKPTLQEEVLLTRVAVTFFCQLTQEDAEAAGYLYLHQLHQDLQEQSPTVEPLSRVAIYFFQRVKDVD